MGCPLRPSRCRGPGPGQSTPVPQDSLTKPRATADRHTAPSCASSLLCCQFFTVTLGWTLSSILQVRDSRHSWKSQGVGTSHVSVRPTGSSSVGQIHPPETGQVVQALEICTSPLCDTPAKPLQ